MKRATLCSSRASLVEGEGRFRVSCFVFRVLGFGFRVPGSVFQVSGFGLRVLGFGLKGQTDDTFVRVDAQVSTP